MLQEWYETVRVTGSWGTVSFQGQGASYAKSTPVLLWKKNIFFYINPEIMINYKERMNKAMNWFLMNPGFFLHEDSRNFILDTSILQIRKP